ncbi:MAG: hypothetical protein HC817_12745 [Saprospiraceae bacterium]|nr:hypothetical protein [Saprospiraceae bacterium]
MRTFDTWTYEQVEDTFGIIPLRSSAKFEHWLEAEGCEPDALEFLLLENIATYFLKKPRTGMKMS